MIFEYLYLIMSTAYDINLIKQEGECFWEKDLRKIRMSDLDEKIFIKKNYKKCKYLYAKDQTS